MVPLRLLIVDDNTRMRNFIHSLVNDLVTDCWEAENGLEAVAQYREHHPDAVLMDIRMPFMDGLEATRTILAGDAHAKVVIVTDFDSPEYRNQADRAGASDYVIKDRLFDLHAILERLEHDRLTSLNHGIT